MGIRRFLYTWNQNLALLVMRVMVGLTMGFGHGLPKLMNYEEMLTMFRDPIGVGVTNSLILAIFGELFCSVFLVLGLYTRLAALFTGITMAVAFFIVHAPDPFARKELALIYLVCYVTIFLAGPGKYSVDAKMQRNS